MALPGDRVEVDPEAGPARVRYELRSSSKPTWALREWPAPADGPQVRVRGAVVRWTVDEPAAGSVLYQQSSENRSHRALAGAARGTTSLLVTC